MPMSCGSNRAACLALGALMLTHQAAAAGVVSLNLCTDELLLALAPGRIAALSPLARDPALSVFADAAAHHPWVRPSAEAVLRLHPDLVLAGQYGAQAAVTILRDRGVRVEQVAEPTDFPAVGAEVTQLAAILGVPARGAALTASMQARLAAIRPRDRAGAIFWEARGYTAGPGSFTAAVMAQAGLANAGTGRAIGIEAMLMHPPDLLVMAKAPAYPSLATDLLAHPALAAIPHRTIAPALLTCPGPWSVAAAEQLSH
jgi:iron complex transport system substrate-binding protein